MNRILVVLLLANCLFSQAQIGPLTASYFSPFGTQFGGKVGVNYTLKDWQVEGESKTKNRVFYLSPQLGAYTKPGVQTSYLLNFEAGLKRQGADRKFYTQPSIGLAYMNTGKIVGGSVHLGSGEITKDRRFYSAIIPTLNLEIGSKREDKLGYFFKMFYGRKLEFEEVNSGFFGFELGLSVNLFKKASTDE